MKAIDKLRNHMKFMCDHGLMRMEMDTVNTHLDEIERELEAEYVPLPKDADGVPIRVGDWITGRGDAKAKVVAVTSDDVYWWEHDGGHWCHAFEVRQYNKPTVESTLQKLLEQAVGYSDAHTTVALDAIAEYATKLRLSDNGEED